MAEHKYRCIGGVADGLVMRTNHELRPGEQIHIPAPRLTPAAFVQDPTVEADVEAIRQYLYVAGSVRCAGYTPVIFLYPVGWVNRGDELSALTHILANWGPKRKDSDE